VSADPLEPEGVDPDVGLLHPPHFSGPTRSDTWRTLLVVSVGGGIGGLARLGVNTLLPSHGASFPWSTFGENVSGCLLIGALMVVVTEHAALRTYPRHHLVRPFLGTGVLGGFTTFSAFTSDTRALLAGGHGATASLYLAGSLVAGLAAVVAGMEVTRRALPAAARQ
jgi:CrcB protein